MKRELLYEDWLVRQEYISDNDIYMTTFLGTNNNLYPDDNDWKNYFLRMLDFLEIKQAKYMISNHHERQNAIPVGIQEWVVKEIVPKMMQLGLLRYAQVVSTEFISNISGEQLVNDSIEANPDVFASRFFDSEEEALAWLLST